MTTNVAPFPLQTRLTQIAMAIKPEGLIADDVCPRVLVPASKFTYTKFTTDELFTIPDTKIGRTSEANQVEFGGVDVTDQTENHGLSDVVPEEDVKNAVGTNFDPLEQAAENVAGLYQLAKEKRVADLLFNLNTYSASLRRTLAGTSQWSDYTNSDPVDDLLSAIDSMLVKPTDICFGQLGWTKFRKHPKVVAMVLNRSGVAGGLTASGLVTREAVADLLELRRVHVGQGFVQTAKKGQAAVYSRLWGKHCALWKVERAIRSTKGSMPTFSFAAQFGDLVSKATRDEKKGLDGATTVLVGERVKELISFQECGYFFQNIVA